jgi:WD40 repeat protein/tRNA A-37 threonylcarbamoyl transferase component Bud32
MPPSRRGRVCPRCLATVLSGAAEDAPSAEPVMGKFGDYELLSVAGRGAMGLVYRAKHVQMGREVALKMVASPVLAGEAAARRFRAEVEAMAALDHPNLMPVYECGEVDGQAFYTMRFVEGGQLGARLHSGEWPVEEKVRLLVKVARAVDYAHRHGVLHRDLKPANIMVDAAGEPYVCDFGLARRLESDSSLTLSGAAIGTPEYMAPEQAGGQSSRVSTAADIYSLGAILYEMLAGRPPFRGGNALETMRRVMEEEPVSPSTISRTADRDLETVALKCLAKEPSRRYVSAAALTDDLERWLRHEPITARRPGAVERTGKWLRRHPALASLLMLGIAGAAAFLWQRYHEEERVKLERDRAEAGWASARARHYAADMDAVADALERGDYGIAAAKLENHRESQDRGLEWDIFHRALDGTQARLLKASGPVRELAWSPDGSLLAAASTDERVTLWKPADGSLVATIPDLSVPNEWDLSAWKVRDAARRLKQGAPESAGALLAVVGLGAEGAVPHSRRAPAAHGLAFSPDGALLATADHDGTKFWRLKDRWIYDWLPGHGGRGVFLDRTHYLVAGEKAPHDLGVFDLESGRWKVLRSGAGRMLAVSPDKRLALTVHDGERTLRGFALPDGALLGEWHDEAFARATRVIPLSSDGTVLLHSPGLPRIMEGHWRERRWLRSIGEGVFSDTERFAPSPDNSLLVITDSEQRVRLHQMSDGATLGPLRGKRSALLGMAWAPAGGVLATGEEDGSVRLWHPNSTVSHWDRLHGVQSTGNLLPSADGRQVICRSAGGFFLANLESGEVKENVLTNSAVPAGFDGGDPVLLARAAGTGPWRMRTLRAGGSETGCLLAGTEQIHVERARLDGKRWLTVWSDDGRQVRLHDRHSGALLWSAADEWDRLHPALAPDGAALATGDEKGRLRVLDWPSGSERLAAIAGTPVDSLAWLPDGSTLCAGCRDGSIRLHDAGTLSLAGTLNGHAAAVVALFISPDGRRLASAAKDTRIRLWDLTTLQPLGRLPAAPMAPRELGGFVLGGRGIAALLWDGTVNVWCGEAPTAGGSTPQ